MASPVLLVGVLSVLYLIYRWLDATDIPKIKGIPEVPGVPVFGNLLQLGDSHAKKARELAKSFGPVFQTRLGNRRVIFANSFDSVRDLWIANQSALISRPVGYTFHNVVSSSAGLTVGTSPWDESCRRRRKLAATALHKPSVQTYMPFIDYESMRSVRDMIIDSKNGTVDIDPGAYFQRYALSTSLTLTYGIRIDGGVHDEMLAEITHVEKELGKFRSTSHNWQDYIPLLRYWPSNSAKPLEYKERRGKYMAKLLQMLKDRMATGTDKPCIIGNILKDPESTLNEAEIMSLCMTMVGAGLDTVPVNLIMCLAYLSSVPGQDVQQRALAEIQKAYPKGDAWERCLREEKVPYITALVKEVLRFWSILPINLPRTSIKDVTYGDAIIPAGMTFHMNIYAAHYDESHFKQPWEFRPERYLGDTSSSVTGTPHYGFGAGSRMCIGSHLASRELYTAFLRVITAFEILPPRKKEDEAIMDCLEANAVPTSLTLDPKPFKIGLKVRDRELVNKWICEAEERTRGL